MSIALKETFQTPRMCTHTLAVKRIVNSYVYRFRGMYEKASLYADQNWN